MERSAFGRIITSLRKEQVDLSTGRSWTQEQLAEASGLSARVIANLERGEKATLEGEVLVRLADLFGLSTLERREFFALAVEVAQSPLAAPQQAVDQMLGVFAELRQPAFFYDDYFDILAANHAALVLHGIEPGWLHALGKASGPPNFLHVIFAADSPLRTSMQAAWHTLALRNLQQVRVMALRHRHSERWNEQMARLRALPDFSSHWLATHTAPDDFASWLRVHGYIHALYGPLHYAVMVNTTYAPAVHLHLTTLLPLDAPTAALFSDLHVESGGGFMRWPLEIHTKQ